MGTDENVGEREQRIVRCRRLDHIWIDAGAGDSLSLERFDQRCLVDDTAASGVYYVGSFFHQC